MFSLFYLYIVRNDDNKDDQSINHLSIDGYDEAIPGYSGVVKFNAYSNRLRREHPMVSNRCHTKYKLNCEAGFIYFNVCQHLHTNPYKIYYIKIARHHMVSSLHLNILYNKTMDFKMQASPLRLVKFDKCNDKRTSFACGILKSN